VDAGWETFMGGSGDSQERLDCVDLIPEGSYFATSSNRTDGSIARTNIDDLWEENFPERLFGGLVA
jgi:hypothetical protein